MKTLEEFRSETELMPVGASRSKGQDIELTDQEKSDKRDEWAQNMFEQQEAEAAEVVFGDGRRVRMNAVRQALGLTRDQFKDLREAMQYPKEGKDA